VVLLIDSSVGIMESDKMLINMLAETHKPYLLVLTKADKIKDKYMENTLKKAAEFIKASGSLCNPNIHAVSS
jgi:GTP-binding protein EngB required for normal cell division